jgi:hypothetical protein
VARLAAVRFLTKWLLESFPRQDAKSAKKIIFYFSELSVLCPFAGVTFFQLYNSTSNPNFKFLWSVLGGVFRRDRVDRFGGIEEMIQRQPEASRMVKKQEREDHGEWNPERELLVNRHIRKGIQKKKAGDRDRHRGCVIDINGAHEITLLPLELQAAVETMAVHRERSSIQRTRVAARASETKPRAQH